LYKNDLVVAGAVRVVARVCYQTVGFVGACKERTKGVG
jgi:hypothetical protein